MRRGTQKINKFAQKQIDANKKRKKSLKYLKYLLVNNFLYRLVTLKLQLKSEVRAFIIIFIIIVENGLSVIDTSLLGTPV